MSIGHSPTQNVPTSPTSSSIPTLKSLRALLPFSPSVPKNSPPPPNSGIPVTRSRLGVFSDGVRRSMHRERASETLPKRRGSLQVPRSDYQASPPVISISPRSESPALPKGAVSDKKPEEEPRRRRSLSLTGLPTRPPPPPILLVVDKPLPIPTPEPDLPIAEVDPVISPVASPRFGPDASQSSILTPNDLSTIIEADTSGMSISKHLPSPTPSPSPSPAHELSHSSSVELDLNVSPSELNNEVLAALGNVAEPSRQSKMVKPPVFTENDIPVNSEQFALELDKGNAPALDPLLASLLSPNNLGSSTGAPLTSTLGRNSSKPPSSSSLDDKGLPRPAPLDNLTGSDSSSKKTYLDDLQRAPRKGSTASGTTESWSPAMSTVAYYAKQAGSSTGSAYTAAPPSPLSLPSPKREDFDEVNANRVPRKPRLTNRRGFPMHGKTSPVRGAWSEADESERGDLTSRPTSAMSRILSTTRNLRTPNSERSDTNVGSTSGYLEQRRSSVDTPRNSLLTRTASAQERRHSPSMDLSSRTPRSFFGQRRGGNWPSTRPRSASVDEEQAHFSPAPQSSRLANRPTHEWLGPRTAKAFKAAGLLEDDKVDDTFALSSSARGKSPSPAYSTRLDPAFSLARTDASSRFGGSGRATPAVSEPGAGSGYFSLMRSARYHENGRPGSSARDHSPVGESPTYTLSSSSGLFREREPARSVSASTAPTSVSSHVSHERDRDFRDREVTQYRAEITQLKEKHNVESSAILSALSDSQRVARVLREENDVLREKFSSAEAEISRLVRLNDVAENEKARAQGASRWRLSNLEKENERLRRDVRDLKGLVAELEQAMLVIQGRGRPRPSISTESEDSLFGRDDDAEDEDITTRLPPAPSTLMDTLDAPSQYGRAQSQRRLSGTSSIFPVVPSNMSMLLHDEDPSIHLGGRSGYSDSLNGSYSGSPNPQCHPLTLSREDAPSFLPHSHSHPIRTHAKNKSVISNKSFRSNQGGSPSANSSFTTDLAPGSPMSLQLSPEHELHLRDMESLNLNIGYDSSPPQSTAGDAFR